MAATTHRNMNTMSQKTNSIAASRCAALSRRSIRPAILALCLLLWPTFAQAQGTVMPNARITYLTNAGAPLVNGKVCTYAAGTSTPQATYSNEAMTTELPNPFRTNSAGRPQNGSGTESNVYWSQSSYKVVVMTAGSDATCATGTTIYTADHVPAIPSIAAATDIEGVAGETLVAGDAVYLSTADGEWYKTDADATDTSSTAGMVGVVPSNIASGADGSIRLQGRITGLSALSAGAKYYLSATAGAITTTPPTNARFIAQADSTTSIVVGGNPGSLLMPDSNGTHNLVIQTTSNLTADRVLNVVPGDAARTVTISGDTTISQNYSTTGTPTFSTVGVADSNASHFMRIAEGSDLSTDRVLTFTTGDADRTVTLTGNPTLADWFDQSVKTTATPSFNRPKTPGGRCSLTTGVAVTTADVSAATTLFYTPYSKAPFPNQITLYDGSTRWVDLTLSQLSITMVGLTASRPYDVFVDYTAGVPALEVVAWTNGTTRATALATQDNVYVQTSDTDSLYVCTIYIDAGGGAVTNSFALRHVWNYYNRVTLPMRNATETANSWAYTTATIRQANANTANQLSFVVGVAEVAMSARVVASARNTNIGADINIGIGLDSTTAFTSGYHGGFINTLVANYNVLMVSTLNAYPAVGYHYASWNEISTATGTTSWVGDGGNAALQQSGISGEIEG